MKANKQKSCGHCKKPFVVHNSLVKVCSPNCAWLYVQAEAKKKEDKVHNERKRVFKENDIPHQHKLTQTVFNKLRVLQEIKWFTDKGLEPECISCGKTNMDWCCGHYKTRGSQPRLRYDSMNTFLQCNRYCNMGLSGNIEGNKNTRGYKQGLLERLGKERGQAIMDYCEGETAPKKWTGLELKGLRSAFNIEIRLMQE